MIRRRKLPAVCIFAMTIAGCSYACHFDARGTVCDAADGQPLPNVRVEFFEADGSPLYRDADNETFLTTDADGGFQALFTTIPSTEAQLTGWTVKFSADGYEDQIVDIGPVREPQDHNEIVYLVFHCALRKAG